MPSPFPGMDPYLETPDLWPDVHHGLISQIQAFLNPVHLRQPLPVIGIPLREPDPDVPLDPGAVLKAAYDRGAYDLSVDYRREPSLHLKPGDRAWDNRLLRGSGMR